MSDFRERIRDILEASGKECPELLPKYLDLLLLRDEKEELLSCGLPDSILAGIILDSIWEIKEEGCVRRIRDLFSEKIRKAREMGGVSLRPGRHTGLPKSES